MFSRLGVDIFITNKYSSIRSPMFNRLRVDIFITNKYSRVVTWPWPPKRCTITCDWLPWKLTSTPDGSLTIRE